MGTKVIVTNSPTGKPLIPDKEHDFRLAISAAESIGGPRTKCGLFRIRASL
jgi:hypothetical protein